MQNLKERMIQKLVTWFTVGREIGVVPGITIKKEMLLKTQLGVILLYLF